MVIQYNKLERKRNAFVQYMKKWGMSNYRIFIWNHTHRERMVFLIHKDHANDTIVIKNSLISYWYFAPLDEKRMSEITSLSSFLKHASHKEVKITLYESEHINYTFESFDELKKHILIRKISGV